MTPEDPLDALLAGIIPSSDDEVAARSAETRSHTRWLRQQTAESATMAGILLSLAEREAQVTLHVARWRLDARLRSVTDALVIGEVADGLALIPLAAIAAVEAPAAIADDRVPGPGPDLAAVLADLVVDHPAVRLLLRGGGEVTGTLADLGKDVAVVRLSSSVVSARLPSLAGCVLPDLGNDSGRGFRQRLGLVG